MSFFFFFKWQLHPELRLALGSQIYHSCDNTQYEGGCPWPALGLRAVAGHSLPAGSQGQPPGKEWTTKPPVLCLEHGGSTSPALMKLCSALELAACQR